MSGRRFVQLVVYVSALVGLTLCTDVHRNPHLAKKERQPVMVHLFEWKFKDIQNECKWLADYGYSGIQVSPVSENAKIPKRPWYERYQPISYKIATRSGNEAEFRSMVSQCNKVGVRIYVDVVFNHMTSHWDAVGTGQTRAKPQDFYYKDVGYERKHFHDPCAIDYKDAWKTRNCELLSLHDLNQSDKDVRNRIIQFLNKLIDIGVAGFRIDAAKHMTPSDLEYIYGQLKNLNTSFFPRNVKPYIFQEVIDTLDGAVRASEYTHLSLVTDFMYSINISLSFKGKKNLSLLKDWGPGNEYKLLKSEDSIVFVDNHDNQRGHGAGGDCIVTHSNSKQYKMAVAFMLAHPHGSPNIMSSYFFKDKDEGPPNDNEVIKDVVVKDDFKCDNGWVCEHRWRQIYNMVGFRHVVAGTQITDWWSNNRNEIIFCRGDKGCAAWTNEWTELNVWHTVSLPPGVYCDVISGKKEGDHCTGKKMEVFADHRANFHITTDQEDGVVAFHVGAKL